MFSNNLRRALAFSLKQNGLQECRMRISPRILIVKYRCTSCLCCCRCLSHPLRCESHSTGHPAVFLGTLSGAKFASRVHRSVEYHPSAPGRCGDRLRRDVPSHWYLLQHDSSLVLLLPVRVVSGHPALLRVSQGGKHHCAGVQAGREDSVLLVP